MNHTQKGEAPARESAQGSEARRWRIIGKFRHGCEWESNETWPSQEEAAATLARWNIENPTPNDWSRVVQVEVAL